MTTTEIVLFAIVFALIAIIYFKQLWDVISLDMKIDDERWKRHQQFEKEARLRNRRYHNFRARQYRLEKLIIDAVAKRDGRVK